MVKGPDHKSQREPRFGLVLLTIFLASSLQSNCEPWRSPRMCGCYTRSCTTRSAQPSPRSQIERNKKPKSLEWWLKDINRWREGQKRKRPQVRSSSLDKQINIPLNTTTSRNTKICWLCQVRFSVLSMLLIDQELIHVTQRSALEVSML